MLSFHAPHSLYAELTLLGIGALVFLYRFVGSNEWLKTHGLILVSYYAIGGLVYDELEGWPLLDTTYFLTVTITTVGYGDMCPETAEGKMFTVIYALVGIVFVFAALSPLVDALMFVKDLLLKPITPKDPTAEDCDDGSFDIDDLRKGGNWKFKYGAALAGPGLIFVIGLIIGFFVMGYDLVDGVYWAMITMTTIGYGDLSASTMVQQIVLCIYLPTAVAALADAIGVVQAIGTAKMLCETDFAAQADKLLLGEAGGANPNPDETLTEAEFLISILKDNGIVDDITVTAIRLQFAHIVRHEARDTPVLDDKMVFCELKAQGRIVQTGSTTAATTPEGYAIERADLAAADGGFAEWREKHWWPRVFDGATYGSGEVRSAPCASGAAADAAASAGFAGAETKVVSAGGETKTFQRLEDGATTSTRKQATVEMEDKGSGDTPLWIFLFVLVLLVLSQVYSDSLPPLSEEDKYDGWALASAEVGDTLTADMMAELSRLMVRR